MIFIQDSIFSNIDINKYTHITLYLISMKIYVHENIHIMNKS